MSIFALVSSGPRSTGSALMLAQPSRDPVSLDPVEADLPPAPRLRRTAVAQSAKAGQTSLASSNLQQAPAEAPRPKVDTSQAFEAEFERGRQLLQRREYFDALKAFQRANQLAGGRSAECHLAMARAMHGMKAYQNAVGSAQSAIELAQGDSRLLARAHSVKGLALQSLAEKEPARLPEAETEFRQALAVDPDSLVADLHFNLGFVLMLQGRDAEGIAEMKRELEIRANGTTAERARELIANPRRARENYAPEFSIVSADGASITSESLRGKVVLLDFWDTSCQLCVRALPAIKKFQKAHAADPLVIVSISGDDSEQNWRAFTEKNGMVWPQYLDRDRTLQHTFEITALPTYVLIDREGIERARAIGRGFNGARELTSAIEKQLR
jgi:tetratricopeptide (TPR) repeat protein